MKEAFGIVLGAIGTVLSVFAVILFLLAFSMGIFRRRPKKSWGAYGRFVSKNHRYLGIAACLVIIAHGVVSIVNATITHEYSQMAVSVAHVLPVLVIVVAVLGHIARKRHKPGVGLHALCAVLLFVLAVIHVAAALLF